MKRSAKIHFAGRTTGLGAGVGESEKDTTEEGLRKANNAERDLHRTFARAHLSLPIPIKKLNHRLSTGQEVSIEYVDPSDWLFTLLTKYPRLLAGGFAPIEDQFAGFWGLYRQSHPGHDVFRFHDAHLGQVLPIMFFGDEGRGPRRAGYMAATIESCLGLTEISKMDCDCDQHLNGLTPEWLPSSDGPVAEVTEQMRCAARLATNYGGNSYLTRFLLFGIPGYLYDKTPSVVQTHLHKVAANLVELFHQGLTVRGKQYYAALVASKGDMKFQAFVVGHLTRSYANLGHSRALAACSMCLAGTAEYPLEDCAHSPSWAESMYVERPYNEADPPVFNQVPYDDLCPEALYKVDCFHAWKVGVGRDVCGSALVWLCDLGVWDLENESSAIDSRLNRAHRQFTLWASAEGKSPALRSFTKSYLNCATRALSPWTNSKGSDTMLICQFLKWRLQLLLRNLNDDPGLVAHGDKLNLLLHVIDHSLQMFQMSYRHPLWIDKPCARKLYLHIMVVVRGYKSLAAYFVQQNVSAFRLKPKLHSLHHLAYEIKSSLRSGSSHVLNWLCYACEMNEDHIGHTARLSRKLATKTLSLRLMQRLFLKTRALARRHFANRRRLGHPC